MGKLIRSNSGTLWAEAGFPGATADHTVLSAVSHAHLRLRHQVSEGLHRLSLLLQDSGEPPQQREQTLNVTVCRCGSDGTCLPGAAALRGGGVGVSLGALVIVLASTVVLLGE